MLSWYSCYLNASIILWSHAYRVLFWIQPLSHTFLSSSSCRFCSSISFCFCFSRSSFCCCACVRTSLSNSLFSGDEVVRIPRWPAINRLATVSVVNGLDPGDVERIREGLAGAVNGIHWWRTRYRSAIWTTKFTHRIQWSYTRVVIQYCRCYCQPFRR